ncbi:MAG: hypothetical protein JXA21_20275 [Anaerolineae bacterium]|nr:hypothetical protein [Anaerolineae bacterium]
MSIHKWGANTTSEDVGDITAVYAGNKLESGGASNAATLSVAFAGDGSAATATRSDHSHTGIIVYLTQVATLRLNWACSNGL